MARLDFAEMSTVRSIPPVYMFVDAFDGTSWAPCNRANRIIHQEEWDEIVERVSAFYATVTSEDIDADNNAQAEYAATAMHKSRPKPNRDKSGFVYILQAGPYYKIGRARNVDKRIEQLATLPPFDINLIHTIEAKDSHNLESQLHGRYDAKRKNGEWFELDEEDVTWLKTL